MPYVGTRSRRGIPPQYEATYAHDPHVGIALDARPTDVCLDCCEEARAEALDCGGLRYTELLGECLCCGATDFAWVPVDFIGPTRRGDAPFQPAARELLTDEEKTPYPEPGDPASIAAYDAWVRAQPSAPPPSWAHPLGPPGRGGYLGYWGGEHHWKAGTWDDEP